MPCGFKKLVYKDKAGNKLYKSTNLLNGVPRFEAVNARGQTVAEYKVRRRTYDVEDNYDYSEEGDYEEVY